MRSGPSPAYWICLLPKVTIKTPMKQVAAPDPWLSVPSAFPEKPDEQRLWHRRYISGGVDLDRGALSSGAYLRTTSQFPESDQIEKVPGLRRGLFLIQQGSAYLLTWILLPAKPPRTPAPARAPPPLETSFTQSVPSPR